MILPTLIAKAALVFFLIGGVWQEKAPQQPQLDPDVAASRQALREGRKVEAEQILLKALDKTEQEAPDNPKVALILFNLGALYSGEHRNEEAEKAYQGALTVCTKLYGPDDVRLVLELDGLSALYVAEERYDEAERGYKRALDIVTPLPQGKWWQRMGALAGLDDLYSRQHRYTEDQTLLEGELARTGDSQQPEEASYVLWVRKQLAGVYEAEAKPEEADRMLQQLSPLARDTDPRHAAPKTRSETERLLNLGDLDQERGDLRGAEDYYNQAAAACEANNDARVAPFLAHALVKLGQVYRQEGSDNEAERVFRRAVDLDITSNARMEALTALANLYRDEHRLSDIIPDIERALNAQEEAVGHESSSLVPLMQVSARYEEEAGDLEGAESLWHRIVKIQERKLSPQDPELARTLRSYARVLAKGGKKDEAAAARARAEAINKQAAPPSGPRVAP